MEYSNLFVCLMGVGTVFIGLICIIILVTVMSSIVRKAEKSSEKKASAVEAQVPVSGISRTPDVVTDELIAAISVSLAEEMGTDIGAIRIRSLRKVQA